MMTDFEGSTKVNTYYRHCTCKRFVGIFMLVISNVKTYGSPRQRIRGTSCETKCSKCSKRLCSNFSPGPSDTLRTTHTIYHKTYKQYDTLLQEYMNSFAEDNALQVMMDEENIRKKRRV